MNKGEYLSALASELQGLTEAERQEALFYYEQYFEDAGIEKEQEVIEELGSPKELAQKSYIQYQEYRYRYLNHIMITVKIREILKTLRKTGLENGHRTIQIFTLTPEQSHGILLGKIHGKSHRKSLPRKKIKIKISVLLC